MCFLANNLPSTSWQHNTLHMLGLIHLSPYFLQCSYTYFVVIVTAKAGIVALWVHILNFWARSHSYISRKKRLFSIVIPVRFSVRLSVRIGLARMFLCSDGTNTHTHTHTHTHYKPAFRHEPEHHGSESYPTKHCKHAIYSIGYIWTAWIKFINGFPHQRKENFISIYVRKHLVFELHSNKM
jgi:hypothetical protein